MADRSRFRLPAPLQRHGGVLGRVMDIESKLGGNGARFVDLQAGSEVADEMGSNVSEHSMSAEEIDEDDLLDDEEEYRKEMEDQRILDSKNGHFEEELPAVGTSVTAEEAAEYLALSLAAYPLCQEVDLMLTERECSILENEENSVNYGMGDCSPTQHGAACSNPIMLEKSLLDEENTQLDLVENRSLVDQKINLAPQSGPIILGSTTPSLGQVSTLAGPSPFIVFSPPSAQSPQPISNSLHDLPSSSHNSQQPILPLPPAQPTLQQSTPSPPSAQTISQHPKKLPHKSKLLLTKNSTHLTFTPASSSKFKAQNSKNGSKKQPASNLAGKELAASLFTGRPQHQTRLPKPAGASLTPPCVEASNDLAFPPIVNSKLIPAATTSAEANRTASPAADSLTAVQQPHTPVTAATFVSSPHLSWAGLMSEEASMENGVHEKKFKVPTVFIG